MLALRNKSHLSTKLIVASFYLSLHYFKEQKTKSPRTVVPEDRSVVVTENTLLDVLGNWVVFFLGGNLHLGLGHLWDFDNHVVGSLGLSLERDVMPRGDGSLGFGVLESQSERFGTGFSLSLQGVNNRVEASRDRCTGRDRGEGRGVCSGERKDGEDRGLELHLCFVSGMIGIVSCGNNERA